MTQQEKEERISARIRRASRIMAYAAMFYLGVQFFGRQLNASVTIYAAADFIALIAFLWLLFEIWGIFRISRE